jgi:hypothetical protein
MVRSLLGRVRRLGSFPPRLLLVVTVDILAQAVTAGGLRATVVPDGVVAFLGLLRVDRVVMGALRVVRIE